MHILDSWSADGKSTSADSVDARVVWGEAREVLQHVQNMGFADEECRAIASEIESVAEGVLHSSDDHQERAPADVFTDICTRLWDIADACERSLAEGRVQFRTHHDAEIHILGEQVLHARHKIQQLEPVVGADAPAHKHQRLRRQLAAMKEHLQFLEQRMTSDMREAAETERLPAARILSEWELQRHRDAVVRLLVFSRESLERVQFIAGTIRPALQSSTVLTREDHIRMHGAMRAVFSYAENALSRGKQEQEDTLHDALTDPKHAPDFLGTHPTPALVREVFSTVGEMGHGVRLSRAHPEAVPDLQACIAQQQRYAAALDFPGATKSALRMTGVGMDRKDQVLFQFGEASYWAGRGLGSVHRPVIAGSVSSLRALLDRLPPASTNGYAHLRSWIENRLTYLEPQSQFAR